MMPGGLTGVLLRRLRTEGLLAEWFELAWQLPQGRIGERALLQARVDLHAFFASRFERRIRQLKIGTEFIGGAERIRTAA